MEYVTKFCSTLEKKDFDTIPISIQKFFYTIAIYCNTHYTGKILRYQNILTYYNYLLLSIGIHDRIYLTSLLGMNYKRYVPDHTKGIIKSMCVHNILTKYNTNPNHTYLYDDIPDIVKAVYDLGANAILVKHGINPEDIDLLIQMKRFDKKSVAIVLLDFDKTISVHKIKKHIHERDTDYIVNKFMGGWDRIIMIKQKLKILEELGVKIGIVTLNVHYRIIPILQRIGWLPPITEEK